jgi:ribonuclease P protein subunit POP4
MDTKGHCKNYDPIKRKEVKSKMITAENILSHEIIGLKAMVLESSNRTLINASGRVVGETKNTFIIRTRLGLKKIIAKSTAKRIRFKLPFGVCFINGIELIGRPEDRISKI